jgi:hypothetical protein
LNPPDGVELVVFPFIVNGLSEAAENYDSNYRATKCSLVVGVSQEVLVGYEEGLTHP